MEYKYYIKKDENDNVIDGFSNAFPRPLEGFTFWKESNDRHFQLPGKDIYYFNNEFKVYKHKYLANDVVLKTQLELDTEIANLKNNIDNKIKKIKEIVNQLLIEQEIKGVNNLYSIQEVLHASGKAKKAKKIEQEYIEDLGEWVEELLYLEEDLDLNSISYDDLHKDNKAIFKDPPSKK